MFGAAQPRVETECIRKCGLISVIKPNEMVGLDRAMQNLKVFHITTCWHREQTGVLNYVTTR